MFNLRTLIAFWLLATHFACGYDYLDDYHTKCLNEENAPVCAQNDAGAYVLFPNECLLNETSKEIFQAESNFSKVTLRHCLKDCNLVCSIEKRPICALKKGTKVRRTFSNSCKMAKVACITGTDWQYQHAGRCVSKRVKSIRNKRRNRRPVACTKQYRPVCAILSGVKSTFINECLFNAENVNTGKNWKIFAPGVCAEDAARFSRYRERVAKREAAAQNSNTQKTLDFDYAGAGLNDDFTLIYVPPIFQTQFIDDGGVVHNGMQPTLADKEFKTMTMQKKTKPTRVPKVAEWFDTKFPSPVNNRTTKSIKRFNGKSRNFCKFGNNTICGSMANKKRSFGNVCELITHNLRHKENWIVLHTGKCDECILNCNKGYDPVCVSRSGINYTLANECYLNYGICQEKLGRVWKKISNGECQSLKHNTIQDKYASTPHKKFSAIVTTTTIPTTSATSQLIKIYSNKNSALANNTSSLNWAEKS